MVMYMLESGKHLHRKKYTFGELKTQIDHQLLDEDLLARTTRKVVLELLQHTQIELKTI